MAVGLDTSTMPIFVPGVHPRPAPGATGTEVFKDVVIVSPGQATTLIWAGTYTSSVLLVHPAETAATGCREERTWCTPRSAVAALSSCRSMTPAPARLEGWPKVTPPATKGKRIFQLRTYESPSNGDHVRKVEMFHSGEFEIFKNAGFHAVFFGDTLIGPRMPNLTYMMSYADSAEMDAKWDVFRNDPAWKKLSTNPRYSSDQIVTNITNLILSPLGCSQI